MTYHALEVAEGNTTSFDELVKWAKKNIRIKPGEGMIESFIMASQIFMTSIEEDLPIEINEGQSLLPEELDLLSETMMHQMQSCQGESFLIESILEAFSEFPNTRQFLEQTLTEKSVLSEGLCEQLSQTMHLDLDEESKKAEASSTDTKKTSSKTMPVTKISKQLLKEKLSDKTSSLHIKKWPVAFKNASLIEWWRRIGKDPMASPSPGAVLLSPPSWS